MYSIGSKISKLKLDDRSLNKDNSTLSVKKENIDNLSDDTLLQIFKYISMLEKLKLSLVCKKWACLLVKNLSINDQLISELSTLNQTVNDIENFIANIMTICGPYVQSISIKLSFIRNNAYVIVKEIAKNCKNIVEIKLDRIHNNHLIEEELELLLKNNKNIRQIHLENLNFEGKLLKNLVPYVIEEFVVINCELKSLNIYFEFLSHLRNIKILTISLNKYRDTNKICSVKNVQMEKIINSLSKSNCESISELFLGIKENIEVQELSNLLMKQKNLKVFKIRGTVELQENFFEFFPKFYLEVLEISVICKFKITYLIQQFKNLKIFKWDSAELTDEFTKRLSECKNLRELNFSVLEKYLLSDIGEKYFSQLPNLESFKILVVDSCIDNLLINLSQCRTLKNLDITNCRFTKIGVEGLSLIPQLTKLNVSKTNITNKQLQKLVKKLLLAEINVTNCKNVSSNVIKLIDKAGSEHKGNKFLKILYNPDYYEQDEYNSDSFYESLCSDEYYDSSDDF